MKPERNVTVLLLQWWLCVIQTWATLKLMLLQIYPDMLNLLQKEIQYITGLRVDTEESSVYWVIPWLSHKFPSWHLLLLNDVWDEVTVGTLYIKTPACLSVQLHHSGCLERDTQMLLIYCSRTAVLTYRKVTRGVLVCLLPFCAEGSYKILT